MKIWFLLKLLKYANTIGSKLLWRLRRIEENNDCIKTADEWKRRWICLTKGTEYSWSQESEDRLVELVATKGKNWALFSKYFDGLHKDKIKYHYEKLMKEGRFPVAMSK